jgi:DNA repair exonuclease SbcCD ATPase subunit
MALKDRLDGIEKSKTTIETELNKIPFLMDSAVKIGTEISKLNEDKSHIERSLCPTCAQQWTGDSAKEKIDKIDSGIKSLVENALVLKEAISQKPLFQDKLERLLKIREETNTQISALQDKRTALDAQKYQLMEAIGKENQEAKDTYGKKVAEIEGEARVTVDRLNEDLKQVEVSLSSKTSQMAAFQLSLAQYEKEVSSIVNVIDGKNLELTNNSNQLFSIKKQAIIADESKRLIKAYVLQTFQETLDAIGEEATRFLAAIPNMSTSTVYFEGCKETKSGSIKDEVVAILNTDGNNDIPIKSLSGGERTAIDLAIDLAVIDVIETKASKGANFLFLDEPFDGLDGVNKENCLEILRQIDTNKKIIMVDHSSELKEMVSDIILVVKKGETSSVVV